jgi:hypothetical protein
MSNGALRPGDLVEVKGPSEILATLDQTSSLDGLPFMPEMVAYCGRRLTVERRADRICDTVHYSGTRRLRDSVLLDDLRCDGTGHAGCQAECRLFWKEVWLRKVAATAPGAAPPLVSELAALRARAALNVHRSIEVEGKPEQRFRCQATELPRCTEHVELWDPLAYLREYTSGNVGLGRFLRVMARAVVQEPMRKLGLIDPVHLRGTAQKGEYSPKLDLQPGEYVRVKSREEIARTLSAEGRNKGLWFDQEMLPFCGQVFRVRQRVGRFVDERDGKLVELKNEAITLDGVVCSGELSLRRWFCPRAIYPFWRECWLERVEAPAQTSVPQRADVVLP